MTTTPAVTTYAQALTAQSSDEVLAGLFADMAALGVEAAGFDAFSVQMALPQLQARAEAALQTIRVQVVQGGNPTGRRRSPATIGLTRRCSAGFSSRETAPRSRNRASR
jgi:hypothetical protein